MDEINLIRTELKNGANPRDIKLRLASEIVKMYHDSEKAEIAKNSWISEVSNKETSADIKKIDLQSDTDILQMIVDMGIVESKSKARRLFDEGAVRINNIKVTLDNYRGQVKDNSVLMIGKKNKFLINKKS
jgi:tyrosyl-tRNA synthetase